MELIVDRIEDGWAVCYLADEAGVRLDIPLRYLPLQIQEGDHLKVNFEIDRESTAQERRKARTLLNELTRGQTPSQKKFKL